MKIRKLACIIGLSVTMLLLPSIITIPGIYAYLTDTADPLHNNFTIALDTTSTVTEKYPDEVPDMNPSGLVSYDKMVQVANTGFLDCFVRIRLNFTEKEIRDETSFSWDGKNYYLYNDYKNHLPKNWTYNPDDDCFYYTNVLLSGDWEKLSENLTYNKDIGEYFYKDNDNNILVGDIITTPLFTHVRTQFKSNNDMRTYAMYIAEESCPFYLGKNYAEAWSIYDSEEWN